MNNLINYSITLRDYQLLIIIEMMLLLGFFRCILSDECFYVYRFCMLIVLIVSCRAKATAVRDGLKLWCRLNENGELETIPGACKDGYVRTQAR